MANNLFISYDLFTPGKDYSKVIEAIKALGSWAKIHKSVWYVKSSLSCEQAAKNIWASMDFNDSLIVIDSTTNNAYWYNLPDAVSKHIQEQWYK
ncbi:hypothetical protein WP8W19C03_22860 [Aeromonas veronii]|uniref:CRISPR-associated protein Cas2 n=1 Tax=Aeromonas veronii TaxID=654 RepID=A0AAC9B5U8_AERVE|nr:hypothetical protein [Aeromonas veronii]ANB51717.1 hypothetical protein WM43_03050 [Aeromonas veronii]KZW96502.1 hypothetical protein WM54_09260 [Aeromonas veronii]BBT95592.1 hypothetical protein WP8W19C03_22860 [Aeromonas veronii]